MGCGSRHGRCEFFGTQKIYVFYYPDMIVLVIQIMYVGVIQITFLSGHLYLIDMWFSDEFSYVFR